MSDVNTIKQWAKKNLLKPPPLVIAGLVILAASAFYIPYHHRYFILERQFLAFAEILLGCVSFLLIPVAKLPFVLAFPFILALGLLIGWSVQSIWSIGWIGKLSLTIVLIANSLLGAFFAAISGAYVEQPYTSCERTLSNKQAIQIVVYAEYAWPKGEHFFVLATPDAGKTWRQALYLRRDDPRFDNNTLCSNVEMLDELTYWVWIDEQAAMTRDGGKTWRTLLKSDIKD